MRIYWINNINSGELGMMPRPKGGDWLFDEIMVLKNYGIDTLVSLLEPSESIELELENESKICTAHAINFISFPIKDRSVPDEVKDFEKLIEQLNKALIDGRKIVIHCRMGIGRTSLLGAGILVKRGFSPDHVFEFLSKARTIAVPDTIEQVEWVKNALRR